MKKRWAAALVMMALLAGGNARAALIDRGGGLVYDDVLKVTWLGDANYARTSGYDADGLMNWNQATTWATNLVFHDSVRNVDYSDWRLPTVLDTGRSGCDQAVYNVFGTDCGWNVQTVIGAVAYSELAQMYYGNMGFKALYSTTGAIQPDYGMDRSGAYFGEKDNLGPNGAIDNLQSYVYWTDTRYALYPTLDAWDFSFRDGFQYHERISDGNYFAWAVREGDVAAAQPSNDVPEPGSMLLVCVGLWALAGVRRSVYRSMNAD